jgi:mono/diheme cytochrome c family protein
MPHRLTLQPTLAQCLPLIASLAFASGVRAAEPYDAFLEKHCIACHGPDKEKGDLRIDQLSRDFKLGPDTHLWAEVIEQVNSGEMPPKKEKRPSQQEIADFITTLDSQLKEGKAARMAARPPVAHYRLSRKEYQNTVYDLLGARYDPAAPGELNEDTLWHGYERIGSELTLSPSHMERYYRAAETVLSRAFPPAPLTAQKIRKTATELRYRGDQQKWADHFGIKRPLRYLMLPNLPHPQERLDVAFTPEWFGRNATVPSGLYRMRLQASGMRPVGGPFPNLRIGEKSSSNTIGGLIELDITAPEDSPEVYEVEVFLERPTELRFEIVAPKIYEIPKDKHYISHIAYKPLYVFTHSSENHLLHPIAPAMFDDKGNAIYPVVLLDWIEWEGPLETEAEKSTRKGVLPPADATPEVVANHLQRFAERAWRRSVGPEELDVYLAAYRSQREAGVSLAAAYQVALKGLLTSRHFLYLVEGEPEVRDHLNDWELASRLSYFLWSSMPDDALTVAARNAALKGEGLKKEVDRLLTDSRIDRFIEDFSRQWLQLHRLGMFAPDKELYPAYDEWLETSLRREPEEFFKEMFAKNRSLKEFIHSDWTMANARLCGFYGLPEPKTDGFQRVTLKPEDQRGGLLTMGAVLGLTSDGTRHRPVHRGVWLSEAIFNKTPPPPPANVDPIEPVPPEGDKVTVRQRLEVHATDANCASCHSRIDPLGFAWENYDAIGQWRTQERMPTGKGKDPVVDASGEMPGGGRFQDANEFKQLILKDAATFQRAFVEHLCTYALRRTLSYDDQADIDQIVKQTQSSGLKDIVRAVATSELMRKR